MNFPTWTDLLWSPSAVPLLFKVKIDARGQNSLHILYMKWTAGPIWMGGRKNVIGK